MYLPIKPVKAVIALIVLTIFFCGSCQEDQLKPNHVSVPVQGSKNGVLPYDFNWEDPNLNWMPYPANQPKITIPWNGAGSLFGVVADDVLADRRKADGWNMVYSTFDPNIWNKNPYFILYNKYRGLLRVFLYINDIQFAESSYIQDGLFTGTTAYKMLNFADKEVVDASVNMVGVDRVEPKPYNGAPLANNKWYFLQFEIAYDPSITPSLSTSPPQFSFYANSINITKVTLGGTVQASINGTIGAGEGAGGSNIWKAVTQGDPSALQTLGTAAVSAIGVGAMSKATTDDSGGNTLGVNAAVWKYASEGVKEALKLSSGDIPGAITGALSAILGGSGGGQTANLTLNGQLQVNGSQTGTGALPSTPVSMYIPGSIAKNSSGGYNCQGYVPAYNKTMGVFNLANKPTITVNKTKNTIYGGQYAYVNTYAIKPGTLNFLWNPVVNGQDATIENVKSEIIVVLGNSYRATYGTPSTTARTEMINGEYALTSAASSFTTSTVFYGSMPSYIAPKYLYLRVSFVVKPKDGSPSSVIVKTFAVTQETTSNY